MRKSMVLLATVAALVPLSFVARAQTTVNAAEQSPFTYEEIMIPMRDGAKLQTVILRPRDRSDALPILLQRTPYGVPAGAPPSAGRFGSLMKDGYIFVFQSMRGRFKSDGNFTLSTGVKTEPNEATDAYDTVDWLVKHVPNNNGRVGMTKRPTPTTRSTGW
ncbi:CocE/NonD family hydrolase [Sphingomonas sp.]|uniref:CocE/NonD family hydrolase n=1 Tax=Sphingomonas sp. TaxID=28214 RepID=UPI0025F4A861|nr:CocE/NonD family hydrolase [Sphingomonas sp.]